MLDGVCNERAANRLFDEDECAASLSPRLAEQLRLQAQVFRFCCQQLKLQTSDALMRFLEKRVVAAHEVVVRLRRDPRRLQMA